MSMDKVFGIAGSALAAQLVRMNTTASNLANAANTAGLQSTKPRFPDFASPRQTS